MQGVAGTYIIPHLVDALDSHKPLLFMLSVCFGEGMQNIT